jgi:hypothetical protein
MGVIINKGTAPTYVKIATQTATSDVASITFSNIPQGYTDLQLIASVRGTGHLTCRINGDSSTLYSLTGMFDRRTGGNSSEEKSSERNTGQTFLRLTPFTYLPNASSTFATINANFMQYSNNRMFKTVLSNSGSVAISNAEYLGIEQTVNTYRSTSAITSLTFGNQGGGGNIVSGSTFTIYGIKAALTPKASGGDIIVQNGQYWYHAFRTTGAFVPRQALTVDYLVVAGGGSGGGGSSGGGGGAGGLRSTVTATGGGGTLETALSLTAGTTYTATVGAGGAIGVKGSNSVFSTITSLGGGAATNLQAEMDGGSGAGQAGGGGDPSSYKKGVGTANQGYGGGNAYHAGSYYPAGGGGGAGAVGGNIGSASQAGNGGVGVAVSITGSSVFYAGGGGGGGQFSGTAGTGGNGGGGAGSILTNGTSGTAGTGGGGGGCGYNGTSGPGIAGTGGSGIVIVRYSI